MTITLTSREFNRNPSAAKRAAAEGPVIITDRGRPRFVLVDYEQYEAAGQAAASAAAPKRTLYDALADPATADIDFDPPRLPIQIFKPAEFDLD